MGATQDLLDDIRQQLAPSDEVLKEARARRDLVRGIGETFPGTVRSFQSGSLAHGTANCPIHQRDAGLDGDAGLVLDRRTHPHLGPDSDAKVGPSEIVEAIRSHVAVGVRKRYPAAVISTTKRAILVEFHSALREGEDPTVDLVVCIDRQGKPGVWIPNTEKDSWDPSHPEKHTELLTAEPAQLRRVRARAIRLAKAENKRTATPPLSSFNIEALALMFVEDGIDSARALLAIWRDGAADLQIRLTPDPAGVSAPIKVADPDLAVSRLEAAANVLQSALDHDDDEDWVRRQLAQLWPDFVAGSPASVTKARLAEALKSGKKVSAAAGVGLALSGGTALKAPRAFGE